MGAKADAVADLFEKRHGSSLTDDSAEGVVPRHLESFQGSRRRGRDAEIICMFVVRGSGWDHGCA